MMFLTERAAVTARRVWRFKINYPAQTKYLISAKIPFFLINDWYKYVSHNPVEISITNFIVIIAHSSGVLDLFLMSNESQPSI